MLVVCVGWLCLWVGCVCGLVVWVVWLLFDVEFGVVLFVCAIVYMLKTKSIL